MTEYVTPEARLGRVLGGRYRLLHVLGAGGTSIVYEAEDHRTLARVALKLLKPELSVADEAGARFEREAKHAVAFAHPAAVRVFDVGEDDGVHWLVSELVDGLTLADHLRTTGPLEEREAIELLLPLVEAVGAAHRRGAIHRDLKPSNVMLAELSEGRLFPKLVDFGLARLEDLPGDTTTGRLLGTPHYMAPEQAAGTFALSPSVDVWALGVILFECLEGRRPFDGPSSTAVLVRVMNSDVPPLRRASAGSPIGTVLARALARSPQDRYADATAFGRALERARSATAPTSDRRTSRTRAWLSTCVALGVGCALGAAGGRASWEHVGAHGHGGTAARVTSSERAAPARAPAAPARAPTAPRATPDPRAALAVTDGSPEASEPRESPPASVERRRVVHPAASRPRATASVRPVPADDPPTQATSPEPHAPSRTLAVTRQW